MELDYKEIGLRVARRWKELGLRQVEICKWAGINAKYLSCIERASSIPSLEVIMKLALALDTTPDEFLTGTVRYHDEQWRMLQNCTAEWKKATGSGRKLF